MKREWHFSLQREHSSCCQHAQAQSYRVELAYQIEPEGRQTAQHPDTLTEVSCVLSTHPVLYLKRGDHEQ